MNKQFISQNLEFLGRQYESEYLEIWKDTNMNSNSWKALKFFFSHSFMRGRRDELSVEYYEFTIKVLSDYFNIIPVENSNDLFKQLKKAKDKNLFNTNGIKELKNGKSNSIKHKDFEKKIKQKNSIIDRLTSKSKIEIEFPKDNYYTKSLCLQNDADLLMVLDTLNFMSISDSNTNLYKYFNDLIKEDQIDIAYSELNKLSGVGDKISTFFLRDIAIMNNYNLAENKMKYIFPVDTWVAQIAALLADRKFSAEKPHEIKRYFIQNFPEKNLPLIAAGIWFLGFNSLNIAIQYVKYNNIEENKTTMANK
ncbi:MAG: hypothetical protein U9N51_07645 [Bacteroidota bacterium]|nr:hypothetical protein [Bacteroidota bacterium]